MHPSTNDRLPLLVQVSSLAPHSPRSSLKTYQGTAHAVSASAVAARSARSRADAEQHGLLSNFDSRILTEFRWPMCFAQLLLPRSPLPPERESSRRLSASHATCLRTPHIGTLACTPWCARVKLWPAASYPRSQDTHIQFFVCCVFDTLLCVFDMFGFCVCSSLLAAFPMSRSGPIPRRSGPTPRST